MNSLSPVHVHGGIALGFMAGTFGPGAALGLIHSLSLVPALTSCAGRSHTKTLLHGAARWRKPIEVMALPCRTTESFYD